MRILVTSPPAVGHIHPMIPLARALQGRGHEVRWATGPDHTESIERAGVPAVACGLSSAQMRADFQARHPEAQSIPGRLHRRHFLPKVFGAISTPPMLADLARLVEGWRPDLLLHDAAEFAAAITAGKLGVPHVTHGFGAIIPSDALALAGTELGPLWADQGLVPDRFAGAYQHLYVAIYPPSMQLPDIADAGRVQLLWPGTADVIAGAGQSRPPRGKGSRPFVYLTFGTVQNRIPAFATAVAALAGLEIDLLVTVGTNGDPGQFGSLPAHVQVERYVAQAQILEHCDLVVSHGGSGTLVAGLACGVPQLCLPQAADQFVNGDAVSAAGAGLSLDPEQADPAAIAGSARRLLEEPAFRAAAARVAAEIASMPRPPEAAAALEHLAGGGGHFSRSGR